MIRYAITAGNHGMFLKRDHQPCRAGMMVASCLEDPNGVRDSGLLPFAPDETLPDQVRRLTRTGVDFLQLREKHLPAGELATLARHLLSLLAETAARDGTRTRLLINSRADVAVAVGAHGVHLPARPGSLKPFQVRLLYSSIGLPPPIVSVACHSLPELQSALMDSPELILFSPVFGKYLAGEVVSPAAGLEALAAACGLAQPIPVLALGGVTPANAPACLCAGAAGVAGIRLFCG